MIHLATEQFLPLFFGHCNDIIWLAVLQTDQGAGEIRPWVELLRQGQPSVLPRRVESHIFWYGLAFNERDFKRLGSDLKAFIGPTYSDFRGLAACLDPQDPVEVAVYGLVGHYAYKFTGNNVWKRLEQMRKLWSDRPDIEHAFTMPVGRLLRDFYTALQACNRESAEATLGILQETHMLDPINITFLKIQLLENLGLWPEIFTLESFSEIIRARRPLSVTRALLKAVYREELSPFEERGDLERAARHFKENVVPRYQNLFTFRANLSGSEILKIFMFFATIGPSLKPSLRDELLAAGGALPERDSEYLLRIASLLPAAATSVEGLTDKAEEALKLCDYDQAFILAVAGEPTLGKVKVLFQVAYEMQVLYAEKAAIETLWKLSEEDRSSFFGARLNRELYRKFTGRDGMGQSDLGELIPTDWNEWLVRLNQGNWGRALEVATMGTSEWDPSEFLARPGVAGQMMELLKGSRNEEEEQVLYNALPHLVAFLQRDAGWPHQEFLNIYLLITDLIVMSGSGGDYFTMFNDLAEAVLELSVDAANYETVLENAWELWGTLASSANLDKVLDLMDMLFLYPCPERNKRDDFLLRVISSLGNFHRRIEKRQWNYIRILCKDINQERVFDELSETYGFASSSIASDADIFNRLDAKSVAVYTLSERVAKRVKEILGVWCRGVNVLLSWDKVGNDSLRQMARSADIFVLTSLSAAHAASGFIQNNRPKELPLLWARGKGSSSILSAVYEHITTNF